jgi:hypothetical protein
MDQLEILRSQYEEVTGEKPHHLLKEAALKKVIKEGILSDDEPKNTSKKVSEKVDSGMIKGNKVDYLEEGSPFYGYEFENNIVVPKSKNNTNEVFAKDYYHVGIIPCENRYNNRTPLINASDTVRQKPFTLVVPPNQWGKRAKSYESDMTIIFHVLHDPINK